MPPVGYPTRGEWVFRNISRDFVFWPRLRSIDISQSHPDALATMDCEVVEDDEGRYNVGVIFANEDECEATFAGTRIWAGIINVPGEDQSSQVGPRAWALTGQDYTSKLDDAIVRRRTKRQREKLIRRVRWLLSWLRPSIWTLDGRDMDLPDVMAERYEYFGMSVREGLQQLAEEHRLFFYIDLDNVFHMFRNEVIPAPFDLDNEAPDYVSTFPFDSWRNDPDSVELGNAVLVIPEDEDDARWTRNPASITTYGRHERSISDPSLDRPAQALNVGARAVAQNDAPADEATVRVLEPGLRAGMRLNVREKLWDHDYARIIKSVEITAVDPHDDESKAQMRARLTLVDRRPARYRGDRGRTTRRRPGRVANVAPRLLDRFGRVVAPPTIIEGDVIAAGIFGVATGVRRMMSRDEVTEIGPDIFSPLTIDSHIGEWYIGANSFRGWRESEKGVVFTITAHPGSMAGIRVGFKVFNATGYASPGAPGALFEVVASPTPPTDIRQGAVIGVVPPDGAFHDIDIPGGMIPAAGESFYVGVRPGWQADLGARVNGYFNWPYASSATQIDSNGVHWGGRSGRGQAVISGAQWLIYSDAGGSLGSMATPAGAPFEGGWAYEDAGSEGSPSYGVTGGALYLTAAAPAGKGWLVRGEREDDDLPNGPWSDMAWAMEVVFSVDEAGMVAEPGTRSIEVVTTGQQQRTIGTVHLGDSAFAEGISVGGPSAPDHGAVDIGTGQRWVALFDSRSGAFMRGRLWRAGARMPANLRVQTDMAETDDDADRWTLWLRGGNGAGNPAQTIRVHRTRYYPAARPGATVVRELIGRADGLTRRFYAAQRFRPGTLRFLIGGTSIVPAAEDPDETWGELDWWPTAGTMIRATYVAD